MSVFPQYSKTLQDKELINLISLGGANRERAIGYLLQSYTGYIYKVHRKLGISEEEAQDAFTDAIMVLVTHIEKEVFRGDSKLSTYLYRIFFNKGVDFARKNSTKGLDMVYDIPQIESGERTILQLLQIEDQMSLVQAKLDQVGEKCRKILIDWGFWGYSMNEIAERSGLKHADSAKKQKYKCLQKLLGLLKPVSQDP